MNETSERRYIAGTYLHVYILYYGQQCCLENKKIISIHNNRVIIIIHGNIMTRPWYNICGRNYCLIVSLWTRSSCDAGFAGGWRGGNPSRRWLARSLNIYHARYIMIHPCNNYQIFPFKMRLYVRVMFAFIHDFAYTYYTHNRVCINKNRYTQYIHMYTVYHVYMYTYIVV